MFSDKSQKSWLAVVTLVFLYWGCTFRGWRTVGELQGLVIPFLLFAFGTGVLLSAFEWKRSPTLSVFFWATAIPVLATFFNLALVYLVSEAHAEMLATDTSRAAIAIVSTAAVVSAVLHGVVALAGFHSSLWFRRQIQSMSLSESALKSLTGVVGLVTAIVGAIVSIAAKK